MMVQTGMHFEVKGIIDDNEVGCDACGYLLERLSAYVSLITDNGNHVADFCYGCVKDGLDAIIDRMSRRATDLERRAAELKVIAASTREIGKGLSKDLVLPSMAELAAAVDRAVQADKARFEESYGEIDTSLVINDVNPDDLPF